MGNTRKKARSNKECPDWLRRKLEEEHEARENHRINNMDSPGAQFRERWLMSRTRMSQQQRLEKLEVSIDDIVFLRDRFGPDGSEILQIRYNEVSQTFDPEGWFQPHMRNGEPIRLYGLNQLMDHFLGRRYALSTRLYTDIVAGTGRRTTFRYVTTSLRLDFDVGKTFDVATVKEAYRVVSSHLCAPMMPFSSSASGGIHGDLPLGRRWEVPDLQDHVHDILERAGVPTGPGVLEVRPYHNQFIRVPLGPGSDLLDADSLEPMGLEFPDVVNIIRSYDGAAGAKRLAGSANRTISLPLKSLSKHRGSSRTARRKSGLAAPVSREEAALLWRDGLQIPGSRFGSIPVMIQHLFYTLKVRDAETMSRMLKQWLRAKHNGYSNRYLENPEAVEKEIERAVDGHFEWLKRAGPMLKDSPDPPYDDTVHLTKDDFKKAEQMYALISGQFPTTDKSIRKVAEGLTGLMLYAKRKAGGNLDKPSFALSREGIKKWLSCWSMRKGSPFYYRHWIDVLTSAGLLEIVDAAAAPGKCRRYKLLVKLGDDTVPSYKTSLRSLVRRLQRRGKKS